ncbi:MAG: fibronectin type III domain-containing protein, partial [Candidatus Moranbacteria bacterium]|nr:fibronectin type III domain-containing protein [Candidatus Moranbacteria bacterium]
AVPAKEGDDIFNRGHNIQIDGLIFQTKYYYKVTCEDTLGNVISSGENNFTTKEKNYTLTGIGELTDSTAPTISNVKVADISGEGATISWDSNEKSNSTVRYGIADVSEVAASDSVVNSSKDNYVTSHSVVLGGLIPATRYVFIVSSIDKAGNIAQSSQDSFTTSSPSSISFIKAQSKELGQAIITWKTSTETTSTVEYGLSTSYGEKKESTSLVSDHSLNLSGLNQGNTYHFRVKGKDKDGKFYASSDQTFDPKSPPVIENIIIDEITEHSAIVSFITNVPTDATVAYQDAQNNDNSGTQGDPDLTIDHKVKIIGLNSGTTYRTTISVRDEQGTQSVQVAKDITTSKDENAPKIDNVKTDSALTQSDKVQAIISWKTDEQATSSILYKEGRNGEEKELKITDNLTTGHIGVITVFKPGTVYNFKVKSIDASGNVAVSNDFALLTPRKKENIIQIIIANFTEIFGWAR